ncbi:MAG: hypothetical protein II628_10190, partial [Lachnospiraceae bacterium]|nr:hypothetical protein [Lachnospiraceae bacterium]
MNKYRFTHLPGSPAKRQALEDRDRLFLALFLIRRTVSSMLRSVLPASTVANMLGHLEATNDQFYNYDYTDTFEKLQGLESIMAQYINGGTGTVSAKIS